MVRGCWRDGRSPTLPRSLPITDVVHIMDGFAVGAFAGTLVQKPVTAPSLLTSPPPAVLILHRSWMAAVVVLMDLLVICAAIIEKSSDLRAEGELH